MIKINNLFNIWLICGLFILLSACGFHLRGEQPLPSELKTLFVQSNLPYAPLVLELKRTLHSAGVKIATDPHAAPVTLQIVNEHFNQQLINISPNTQVSTYHLQYIVTILLLNSAGKVIYGPMIVQSNSSYASSDTQIMADNSQLREKQNLMRLDLVGLIFNRLNSTNVKNAIEKHIR